MGGGGGGGTGGSLFSTSICIGFNTCMCDSVLCFNMGEQAPPLGTLKSRGNYTNRGAAGMPMLHCID